MTHPLTASAAKAAARDTGATAKGKDLLKRDKYSRNSTGACRFVPLSHEMFRCAGPAAFDLLNEIAEFAASCKQQARCLGVVLAHNALPGQLATLL